MGDADHRRRLCRDHVLGRHDPRQAVADTVTTHEAWGLGVYCVFYAAPVVADNAIETPTAPGVKLHHMITLRLNGQPGSGIKHVINGTGDAVITNRQARVD